MSRLGRPALTSIVLGLLGLGVSTYLTIEHYSSSTTLACPATGALDCLKVTTSKWSVVAGVPVALLGLLFFAGMLVLSIPAGVLADDSRVALVRVVGAGIGAVTVLYLVYLELFQVGAICLWCTAVHVLTIALLGTSLWWRESSANDS
jgi:uncharacterized membrane protein